MQGFRDRDQLFLNACTSASLFRTTAMFPICSAALFLISSQAQSILRKICRVNRQLRKQSENKTRQAIPILPLLVEEIDHSLRCWCLKKKKVTTISPEIYYSTFRLLIQHLTVLIPFLCLFVQQRESSKPSPKWKLCKVKHVLATIQTYFEQYNASQ